MKKIIFSIGATLLIIMPLSFVISCSGKSDQDELNDITDNMIKNMLNITPNKTFTPNLSKLPKTLPPETLDHLNNVIVTMSNWKFLPIIGELSGIATVSKKGLITPSNHTIIWKGYLTTDQNKMNGIIANMVKKALNIIPSSSVFPDTINQPATTTATFNGLDGVSITIKNWAAVNKCGTISATVEVSKKGLTSPPPFNIEWKGYLTIEQDKINHITSDMVKKALNIIPSSSVFPDTINQPATTTATLNGLDGVSITIKNWAAVNKYGTISATVEVSKKGSNTPNSLNIKWKGYLTTDQKGMNDITPDIVKKALNIIPSESVLPSSIPTPMDRVETLNDVDNISINIKNWVAVNIDGTISATVEVSKKGLTPPPPFKIKWIGYMTSGDQNKMNHITNDMIKQKFYIKLNIENKLILPSSIHRPIDMVETLNGLKHVSIVIDNWAPKDDNGELNATITISKTGLKSPDKIILKWVGFMNKKQKELEGITGDMVKKAMNVNPDNGSSPSTISKPKDQTVIVNNLENVMLTVQKWTTNNYRGEITAVVLVWKQDMATPTTKTFTIVWNGYKKALKWIPRWYIARGTPNQLIYAKGAKLARINSNTLLMGTKSTGYPGQGIFKVNISDPKWWLLSRAGLEPQIFPRTDNRYYFTITKINDTTFLVGGFKYGFYKLDTSSSKWTWTKQKIPSFTDEDVGVRPSSTMIDQNSILVGTKIGFWNVNINSNTWIWKKTYNGIKSPINGDAASMLKIGNSKILVGTLENGFYNVDASQLTLKWKKETFIGKGGSITKVKKNTFFVTTNTNGFWKLDTNDYFNWKWIKIKNYDDGKRAYDSRAIMMNEKRMLVGGGTYGLLSVDVSSWPWRWTKEECVDNNNIWRNSAMFKLGNNSVLVGEGVDETIWRVTISNN